MDNDGRVLFQAPVAFDGRNYVSVLSSSAGEVITIDRAYIPYFCGYVTVLFDVWDGVKSLEKQAVITVENVNNPPLWNEAQNMI